MLELWCYCTVQRHTGERWAVASWVLSGCFLAWGRPVWLDLSTNKLMACKNVFSLPILLAWTLCMSLYRLLWPPSYVLVSRLGHSIKETGRYTAHTCSFAAIRIDSAGCCFQQALQLQNWDSYYRLARCAKLDTLDFCCAVATIADFPFFLNTPSG